jgi:hypothetical protein
VAVLLRPAFDERPKGVAIRAVFDPHVEEEDRRQPRFPGGRFCASSCSRIS